MTLDEYNKARHQKYGAIPVSYDGYKFKSKKEGARYLSLKLLQRAGHITNLELQPVYLITINGKHICKVILDFRYYTLPDRKMVIEDVKGKDNALSKLKRAMVEAQYGIKILLT